jgi:hypothetical protein
MCSIPRTPQILQPSRGASAIVLSMESGLATRVIKAKQRGIANGKKRCRNSLPFFLFQETLKFTLSGRKWRQTRN